MTDVPEAVDAPRCPANGHPRHSHHGGPLNGGLDLARAAEHCRLLEGAVADLRVHHLPLLQRWGETMARRLVAGGRLLAAGNGGSAAQAQHLTAELVGRYRADRPPYSAISLHAETSSLTAIGNDYGFDELFARQVTAHGRPGDILILMSTSGRSPNLLRAADTGRAEGLTVWAMTGPPPNSLAERADEALCVGTGGDAGPPTATTATTATVQETHLVALHLLCEEFDASLSSQPGTNTSTRRKGHEERTAGRRG